MPTDTKRPNARNFVAKNAKCTTSGAGAHVDKKKELKRGRAKNQKTVEKLPETFLLGSTVETCRGDKVSGIVESTQVVNGNTWVYFRNNGQLMRAPFNCLRETTSGCIAGVAAPLGGTIKRSPDIGVGIYGTASPTKKRTKKTRGRTK